MAITIKQNLSGPALKFFKSAIDQGKDFSFVVSSDTIVTDNGGESTEIINDVTNTIEEDATSYKNYQIILTSNDFIGAPEFISENTNIATVNSDGEVERVSDGVAKIIIDVEGYRKSISLDVSESTPSSQVVSSAFNAGTLGKHCSDAIDDKIVGKKMASNGRIFASQNHNTNTFVRNEDVWCYDYDLTCISPSNSNKDHRKAGTLLTPRHIDIAAHHEYGVGTKVYFVSQDGNNTVYERTVVSKVRHPEYSPYFPDITICALDSDLPSDKIKPCKVLPTNYTDYLIETELGRPPSLSLDQEEKALVTDLYSLSTRASFTIPNKEDRLEFYESKIAGDSGNPSFLIINNELVLLTLWTYGGAGSGTFITPQISDINSMIATADSIAGNGGTGYEVSEVDLSDFEFSLFVEKATALWSTDQLYAGSDVVRVRRNTDDSERSFTAKEIGNGDLLDFVVPTDVQALYDERMYFNNDSIDLNSTITLSGEFKVEFSITFPFDFTDNPIVLGDDNGSKWIFKVVGENSINLFRGNSGSGESVEPNEPFVSGNIYNITVTRNSSNVISFTVDGVLQNETVTKTEDIDINVIGLQSGSPYKGSIWDVKIDTNNNGTNDHHWEGYGIENSDWEDQIGSNDGTVVGSPALFTGQGFNAYFSTKYDQRVPTTKQRMYFDGSDDEVEVAYDAVFDRGSSTLKVRGKFITTKTETILIDNRNSNPNIKGFFIGINGAGKINTKLYEGSTSVGETINSVASCNDGKEHTFEWIYDGATLSLQLDNATPVTVASVNGDTDGIFPIVFGNVSRTSSLGRLEGTIYDVEWEVGEEVVGHWQGYGNTDADWKDQIGSNDGTVSGNPARLSTIDYTTVSRDAVQTTSANQPLIVKDGALNLKNTKAMGLYDGDHMRIPANDLPSPTDKFTVSAVVRNNKSGLSANEVIFGRYDTEDNERCFLIRMGVGEDLEVLFGDPGNGTFGGRQSSDAAIAPDELQVVGVTFDSGTVKLYRNGVGLDSSVAPGGSIPALLYEADVDWTIGCLLYSGSPAEHWDGDIAEIYYADNTDDDIVEIQQNQMSRFGIS